MENYGDKPAEQKPDLGLDDILTQAQEVVTNLNTLSEFFKAVGEQAKLQDLVQRGVAAMKKLPPDYTVVISFPQIIGGIKKIFDDAKFADSQDSSWKNNLLEARSEELRGEYAQKLKALERVVDDAERLVLEEEGKRSM